MADTLRAAHLRRLLSPLPRPQLIQSNRRRGQQLLESQYEHTGGPEQREADLRQEVHDEQQSTEHEVQPVAGCQCAQEVWTQQGCNIELTVEYQYWERQRRQRRQFHRRQ